MSTDDRQRKDAAPAAQSQIEGLLREHLPALHGFVRLRTGPMLRSMEETSDLVQSICREILEHQDRFQHPDRDGFKRWLYATALRKIANRGQYHRAQKREIGRQVSLDAASHGAEAEHLLACYGSFCSPSRIVGAREEIARIEGAFDRLPEHYREVIALARIVGLSHAEIAERTDRSEGAVRILLYRALEALSSLLEE